MADAPRGAELFVDGQHPKFKDPCANCPGDCGVANHWDDRTTVMPTPDNAVGVRCFIHPQCGGYDGYK